MELLYWADEHCHEIVALWLYALCIPPLPQYSFLTKTVGDQVMEIIPVLSWNSCKYFLKGLCFLFKFSFLRSWPYLTTANSQNANPRLYFHLKRSKSMLKSHWQTHFCPRFGSDSCCEWTEHLFSLIYFTHVILFFFPLEKSLKNGFCVLTVNNVILISEKNKRFTAIPIIFFFLLYFVEDEE